jgi:glycosyltransferase involved in cell wall biosynthesis
MVAARYYPFMGGIETHVYEVARRIADDNVDVTVLTTDPSGNLPTDELVDGAHIRRVKAYPSNADFYVAPDIWRIVSRGNWDVVHCQGVHTAVPPLAMLAARRAGIPYVLTFHTGGHSSRTRNAARSAQWRLMRPLLAGAETLIGVSQFEADFFRDSLRLPAEQFQVIPNGSHFRRPEIEADVRPAGTLIVSTGRLERYKGHHRVIRALPFVRARRPDARLLILGAGPYRAELEQIAQTCGVRDHVEIRAIPPADRQAMATTLANADVVTLLSDYEAHPVAVMEAVSLGRPVLVADTSGLRELADRGLARAIPVESSPQDTATAILRQIDEPLVTSTVDLPTWEGCAAALLDVYREVSARRRSRRTPCAS